ncbi:Cys-tRNA(Pro) deacylase [Pusillimonas sp.]|uniref:Cys-tRNA(Pro) deacylase n=1 Tax=Pusillimonas sp. TaxID=3040095 RepID=UPI0037CBABAB
MSKHISETRATQLLRRQKIEFGEHPYKYVEHGGAPESARQLGVDSHQVAKTLIMEDENGRPLVVLMHGDCEVSTKNLARQIGAKKVAPCAPATAQRHSGYMVGGTSPFATRKKMSVWVEKSLLDYPMIYLNGGRRGYLISLSPSAVMKLLDAGTVEAALPKP